MLPPIYGLQEAHQQKVYLSLGVFGSYWTRIPGWSKLRVDWTDAVAFRCTWERWQNICVDIEGLVSTGNHLGVPTTSLEASTTRLGAQTTSFDMLVTRQRVLAKLVGEVATSLGVLVTSLGAPEITVEQSGKNHIIFGNAAGAC